MGKLTAVVVTGFVAALAAPLILAGPAMAADLLPPTYQIPPVDYGLGGSFYLRGSVAGSAWWATDGSYCGCIATFTSPGYGASGGIGFGYETGSGLRADLTIDYLAINGLTSASGHTVNLRSGLVLANAYYDFGFGDYAGSASGGFGGYVGAGIGFAKNLSEVYDNVPTKIAWGTSVEGAAAIMAGVTYDMGKFVADLGYRGIYMNKVMSQPPLPADAYIINNNFISELRATVRYRLN